MAHPSVHHRQKSDARQSAVAVLQRLAPDSAGVRWLGSLGTRLNGGNDPALDAAINAVLIAELAAVVDRLASTPAAKSKGR